MGRNYFGAVEIFFVAGRFQTGVSQQTHLCRSDWSEGWGPNNNGYSPAAKNKLMKSKSFHEHKSFLSMSQWWMAAVLPSLRAPARLSLLWGTPRDRALVRALSQAWCQAHYQKRCWVKHLTRMRHNNADLINKVTTSSDPTCNTSNELWAPAVCRRDIHSSLSQSKRRPKNHWLDFWRSQIYLLHMRLYLSSIITKSK